jgi:hypothetical protein
MRGKAMIKGINIRKALGTALAVIVVFVAFDTASAQSTRRSNKESVRQLNSIKQYCYARFRNNKAGRDNCVKKGEAAMQRIDKLNADPKKKAYCRNLGKLGRYALMEKCISSLSKPRTKPKKTIKKGTPVPFPGGKPLDVVSPRDPAGRGDSVGAVDGGSKRQKELKRKKELERKRKLKKKIEMEKKKKLKEAEDRNKG